MTLGASDILIRGGSILDSSFPVHGHKHSLVQIIAAACGVPSKIQIINCPNIEETKVLMEIINLNGGSAVLTGDILRIDTTSLRSGVVPYSLANRIHGSIYLLPVFLGRFGEVKLPETGGCQFGGSRPIEHMVSVLRKFGAEVSLIDRTVNAQALELKSCTIDIREYSDNKKNISGSRISGATKTALLSSLFVRDGDVEIRYPGLKADVSDLITLMKKWGFDVSSRGIHLKICAPTFSSNFSGEFELIPCVTEIMTYITFAVVNGIKVSLFGIQSEKVRHELRFELEILDQMGITLHWEPESVRIVPSIPICPIDIDVNSYGIYSDHQPFFALMLLKANGRSIIRDFIWPNRFEYARELIKLGANISFGNGSITILPSELKSTHEILFASDLRAAAVLTIAATSIPSYTRIRGLHHLNRGYSDLLGHMARAGIQYKEFNLS